MSEGKQTLYQILNLHEIVSERSPILRTIVFCGVAECGYAFGISIPMLGILSPIKTLRERETFLRNSYIRSATLFLLGSLGRVLKLLSRVLQPFRSPLYLERRAVDRYPPG